MKRIILMILRSIPWIPTWFYHICKYGRPDDPHTEQQKYDYLRAFVKKINKKGRVTVKGYGQENLPEEEGFILFPNHQGLFDMLALMDSCPHPLSVVIKKEAANIILIKQVLAVIKGLSIDREDVRASLKVIQQVTKEVKEGRNYVIFSVGTRSKDGNRVLPFKGGTFKSAVNANCPIVPVAMVDCFLPFDVDSIRKVTVEVHYLKPIYPEEYKDMKTVEIAKIVQERIQAAIDRALDAKNKL